MRKGVVVGVVALVVLVAVGCRKDFDFDADGKADKVYVTNENADWYQLNPSPDAPTLLAAGHGMHAPGDYDGDGRWEPAANGGSTWWSLTAGTQTVARPSGSMSEITMAQADYDGDGTTDPAYYRETDATWHIDGQAPVQFGTVATHLSTNGLWGDQDYAVPADYDGDAKADLSTYNPRTATWRTRSSKTGLESSVVVGRVGAWPAPADYDGDGKADRATAGWDGVWVIDGQAPITFTVPSRNWWPAVADYDGDRKADIAWVDLDTDAAVTTASNWHIRSSQSGTTTLDVIPAASTPGAKSVPAAMDFDIIIQTARFNAAVQCHYNPSSCFPI